LTSTSWSLGISKVTGYPSPIRHAITRPCIVIDDGDNY
jgi:hypothetical protein